ncbi:uncharacterized protein HMPREF1541_02254 [Cyphellophora europaea CBS 101466]|uniref:Fe2OG dioxygenase domain-containing protein n=1 Tax=Cyphellophora europaea (strain CBS 101466) TaxID=1220924 RepID=W2S307_CYPE1|nr:uncharacterized protein HMPREF1541_02254 [Cyphellophora europaea CBS 101466]ETN43096.1 hypothetical protein HMPREF1541_02254 [Cyphellophora europaea CBS 101466]
MPAKTKGKGTPNAAVADKSPAPNWPSLKSGISPNSLYVETLLDDQILIIRNLFSSKLCKDYVSFLSSLPLTTTPGTPKRGEAVRVNDRFQIDDYRFAQQLWEQTPLKHLVESYEDQSVWRGHVLGLNPNIRVYRYRPGQFFDQHYDESNNVSVGESKVPGRTTWTLLIYLTTCDGGETAFYPEPARKRDPAPEPILVGLEVGMALLHNHEDCMLHEGREVTKGEKWVLRSDLVVKR